MYYPVSISATSAPVLPGNTSVEKITEACGYYFRTIILHDANTIVPQHTHDHDHATLVGHGAVRAWKDGEWFGDFKMGDAIVIPAGCSHLFQALCPETVLTCVHNVDSVMSLKRKGF
jgi:mannose-6-phosphate isomerase-like protein (cupin superfamily)